MKNYEYQILRFMPDRINAEFINVGLVFYSFNDKVLKTKFIKRSSRLSSFFHGLNTRYIFQSLKHLEIQFENIAKKLTDELEFSRPKSVEEITLSLLPKDDASLIFSDLYKGVDISLEKAFTCLTDQLLFRYDISMVESETLLDEDVWRKVYKDYFDKVGVKEKLVKHVVETANDKIEFQRAWKNDKWHCYQPVSFALSRDDSIKNKAYRWYGKIQELQTAKEPIKLELLTVLPQKRALREFIFKLLQERKIGQSMFSIVDESNAEDFAQQLSLEFEEHID